MSSIPLTLKLKNKKKTVFVLVDKQCKVSDLAEQLSVCLNQGGPRSGEADAVDDDLDIPMPSFETNDEPSAEAPEVLASEPVDPKSLRIALPNSKTELSKGWKDITDAQSTLEELGVRDLAILAYKLDTEHDFDVIIATDDDI